MKIAIIGCGEVGGAYTRALRGKADLELCDIVSDGRPGALAKEMGLPLNAAPGDWLTACDAVIAAVPGKESPVAARDALPFIAADALYIDVSTGAPADLFTWSENYREAERDFVDVAIVGSIPIYDGATPVLMAGERAEKAQAVFELMGAPVKIMDDAKPGDAVALKLLRSIIMKGLECLSIECLTAAEHLGLRPQVLSALQDLDDRKIADVMSALVRSHLLHAKRRMHEMEESSAQLKALGFDAAITQSLSARYAATLKEAAENPPSEAANESLDEAIAWLMPTCRTSA